MSIDPNLFASSSGLGPQTSGYGPTPSDRIDAAIRQQSSQALYDYSLYSSPHVRAASGLVASGLAGDPSQASNFIRNTASGQFVKDMAAMAAAAGVLPGGNPMQLAASTQQMIATQGFNIAGNLGRGSPHFGGGTITDMMSRSVFDSVRNNFFDQVTGLPKSAAHGMNMTQMSEAMNQLTGRGAFRGVEIGELNKGLDNKVDFKIDKQKMAGVNKTFSDYAGMLKDARQVFGDLPIAELTQNAERLIGTSIREMGSISAMRSRMANIKATSAAFGLNPAAVAQNIMQGTDAVQAAMYENAMRDPRTSRDPHLQALNASAHGRLASDVFNSAYTGGLQSADSSTAMSNAYAAKGIYMPTVGNAEAAQALAGQMQQMMSERESGVLGNTLAATHMLSTGKIKDPAAAAKIDDLIEKAITAGSPKQQEAFNQQIAIELAASGIDIDNYKSTRTSPEMQRELDMNSSRKFSKRFEIGAKRRLIEPGVENLGHSGNDYGLFKGDSESVSANRENFSTFMGKVNYKGQEALLAAVGANGEINEDVLNNAYATIPYLSQAFPKEDFTSMISGFAHTQERTDGDLRTQLKDITTDMNRNARVQYAGNEMDSRRIADDAVKNYLSTTSLGAGMDSETLGTELMRGFFGTGKIDSRVALESIKNKDKSKLATFEMRGDNSGFAPLNKETFARLSSVLGPESMAAIAAQVGTNSDDELMAALGTETGFAALQANLGSATMGVNDDGTLSIASGDQIANETKELEVQAMLTAKNRLFGADKKIGGDLNTEAGRAQYNKDILSELTKNKSEELLNLSDKFKGKDYGGKEFEAFAILASQNPAIGDAIKASAQALRGEDDPDSTKKAKELLTLDRELQSFNGGGGNKYLGVLEILTESLANLKLYQE